MRQVKLQLQENEMKRQHEIYQMSLEDERSKCLKLKTKMEQEVGRARQQSETRNNSQVLSDEEQNIDAQLSMSKPLVTEIMEFFYNKDRESCNEESLEELVEELQKAVISCLKAEEQFQQAAYYNPQDNLHLQRKQRDAYAGATRFGS